MVDKNYAIIRKFYIMLLIVTAAGAAGGALYYVNLSGTSSEINEYIKTWAHSLDTGMDRHGILMSSLRSSLILTGIFIICSFARPGMIIIAAVSARRGFIYGFTNAAFIGMMGQNGVLAAAVRIPELVLTMSGIFILGSVCCDIAHGGGIRTKKNLIFFLIFLFVCGTIFCTAAFAESFLTTTFMKMVLNTVT